MGVSPNLPLPALHSLHYQQLAPEVLAQDQSGCCCAILPFCPESHCLKVPRKCQPGFLKPFPLVLLSLFPRIYLNQ